MFKKGVAVFGAALLVLVQGAAHARISGISEPSSGQPIGDARLLDWELPEMAQQQPAPVTPTPPVAPAPVTPPVAAPAPAPAPAATPPDAAEPADPAQPPEDATVEDEFSIGDIPVVETVELKLDTSKKALDTYVLVRDKYKDAELENYENLQDFVDQSAQGKAFEVDVKAAGFANVTEWNTTITTLSFAYDNSVDDQSAEIKQQITELQADTDMAQDMKDRMVAALNAMIPSETNKQVVEELKKDPAYAEKLKLLETEAE